MRPKSAFFPASSEPISFSMGSARAPSMVAISTTAFAPSACGSILVIFWSFAARSISSIKSRSLLLPAGPSVPSPTAMPAARSSITGATPLANIKLLAEKGVGGVHNPSSNMMLASGVAPGIEERAAGIAVGLGTDGPAGSNNDLDLMEEMDLAAKLQKITKMDPRALGAKAVVEMATIEGAKAVHLEKEIGSLEAGKKADIILISLDAPNAVPMYDVYSQLAYALKASEVETVIIGGRVVMRDRKLLTIKEEEVLAKAREYGKKVEGSLK